MSSELEYKYSPLPGRDWIRLLRLKLQADNESLADSLVAARLDNYITLYISLSYG
jgi:hypothetical protein